MTTIPVASVVLTDTCHGKMWVFKDDIGCSRLLREYGEYSEIELGIMKSYISPESVVLDVGAHIGAHTIPLAKVCKKVYAVEPQAEVVEILKKNIELAGVTNVEILPFALGFERATKFYTPNMTAAGSISMEDTGECSIEVYPLDDLGLTPDFIKIDAEGMELPVIAGGIKTITEHRPYIFAERMPNNNDLLKVLTMMGYCSSPMVIPVYVPNNWKHNPVNYFPNQGHMMNLAAPLLPDNSSL